MELILLIAFVMLCALLIGGIALFVWVLTHLFDDRSQGMNTISSESVYFKNFDRFKKKAGEIAVRDEVTSRYLQSRNLRLKNSKNI